jgi:hypothetical protein
MEGSMVCDGIFGIIKDEARGVKVPVSCLKDDHPAEILSGGADQNPYLSAQQTDRTMVIPCLSCVSLDKHSYTLNPATERYEYHLSCKKGTGLPDPMPREGFSCSEYENKLAVLPRTKRSACAIEIRKN